MTKGKKTYRLVESEEIYLTYNLLLNKKWVSFPLTQEARDKVKALTANINNPHFDREIYPTIEEKVVAYLLFIIKDRPFIDGNKRTACLVFEIACDINNIKPRFDQFTLDELAVYIEQEKNMDHQEMIKLISKILFKQ